MGFFEKLRESFSATPESLQDISVRLTEYFEANPTMDLGGELNESELRRQYAEFVAAVPKRVRAVLPSFDRLNNYLFIEATEVPDKSLTDKQPFTELLGEIYKVLPAIPAQKFELDLNDDDIAGGETTVGHDEPKDKPWTLDQMIIGRLQSFMIAAAELAEK